MSWTDDDVMPLLDRVPAGQLRTRDQSRRDCKRSNTTLSSFSVPVRWPPAICSASPTTRSTRRRAAACRRGRVAGTEAVSMGDDPVRLVRLGPHLVHITSELSGS
jgi:hypothetical protein